MEELYRPGSEMHDISQMRAQKFNRSFFASLIERAESSGFHSTVGGDLSFDPVSDRFPSLDEAWNVYRTQAQQQFIKPDYMAFQEGYKQVQQLRDQQTLQDLSYATNAGATAKDIQNLARKNKGFHSKLINMSATNPELAAQLHQFLPGPTLSEKIAASPGYYSAATVGTGVALGAGANYLGSVPQETKDAARAAYKSTIKGVRGDIRASRELVAESKAKIAALQNEKIRKGIPAQNKVWKKKMATAQSQLKKSQEELAKHVKKIGSAGQTHRAAQKTRYQSFKDSKWMKGKLGVGTRVGAYMVGPMMIGQAAGAISDDETVGEVAQKSASAAIGAKLTADAFSKALKKKGKKFLWKKTVKKVGYSKALRLLGKLVIGGGATALSGGLLTGLMAAWTVKDLYDIMQILSEEE